MESLQEHITKEEIATLSHTAFFPGQIHLVETAEEAEAIFDQLERQPVVGFDTESKPCFTRGETAEVALIQISTLEDAYLIRVNKTDFTPRSKPFLPTPIS